MKISSQESDIEISPHLKTSNFQLALTRHSIQLLSSGLYSDKHRAVVRELSCNAWDSHKMNGNEDEPFEVHLPQMCGDNTFRVRDYGTGISHEDLVGLYSTYMASSKQSSNDQTGCFGLGSKSPFAVTSTFTVTSWFGGEKIVFVATIDDNGLPTLTHLMTAPSEERTGLEVSFKADKDASYNYAWAAQAALRPFNPLPIVYRSGEGVYEAFKVTPIHKEKEVVLEGSNFTLIKAYMSSTLTMGNVDYTDALKQLNDSYPWLRTHAVHLTCPIGTFEVTPSRESLSWTPHSEEGIRALLDGVTKEITTASDKLIAEATCFHDAILVAKGLESLKLNLRWKGKPVNGEMQVGMFSVSVPFPPGPLDNGKEPRFWQDFAEHRRMYPNNSTKSRQAVCSTQECKRVPPLPADRQSFVWPRGTSPARRLMHFVRESNGPMIVLIDAEKLKTVEAAAEVFGIPVDRIKYSDEYPLPERAPRAARKTFTAATVGIGTLTPAELDVTAGGVYVQLVHSKLKVSTWDGESTVTKVRQISDGLSVLHELQKKSGVTVYATRAKLTRKLAKLPQWIELGEYMRGLAEHVVTTTQEYLLPHPRQDRPNPHEARTFLRYLKDALPPDLTQGLTEETNGTNGQGGESYYQYQLTEVTGISWVPSPEIHARPTKAITERYPLLNHLHLCHSSKDAVMTYMLLIEKERKDNGI